MTRQAPEWIIFDGRRERLDGFPWPFPPGWRLPEGWGFQGSLTAHARGYTTTWRVEDGRLFLEHVAGRAVSLLGREVRAFSMRDLLGSDGPVFADWFSGSLFVGARRPGCDDLDLPLVRIRAIEVAAGHVVAVRDLSRKGSADRYQRP